VEKAEERETLGSATKGSTLVPMGVSSREGFNRGGLAL
jgi:hypothetical protein